MIQGKKRNYNTYYKHLNEQDKMNWRPNEEAIKIEGKTVDLDAPLANLLFEKIKNEGSCIYNNFYKYMRTLIFYHQELNISATVIMYSSKDIYLTFRNRNPMEEKNKINTLRDKNRILSDSLFFNWKDYVPITNKR